MDSKVVLQEELGNYDLNRKTVIWKSKEYNFDEYGYDGGEYVMYKIGVNEEPIEVGRICCNSRMLVMIEEDKDIEILEVIE